MKRSIAFLVGLLLLMPALPTLAQFGQFTQGPSSGGGGITLITSAGDASTLTGGTTSAVDTSGSTLLIAILVYYDGAGGTGTIADSKSNSWVNAGAGGSTYCNLTHYCAAIYKVNSPTVGSGHTFTSACSGGNCFPAIMVATFSGTTSSSIDTCCQTSTNNSDQPGSVTAVSGELYIAGYVPGSTTPSGTPTVNSSFIIPTNNAFGGVNATTLGGGLAYKISSGSAENPTWSTSSGGTGELSIIGAFK